MENTNGITQPAQPSQSNGAGAWERTLILKPTYPTGCIDCFRETNTADDLSPAKLKLNVIVVGAGIGGLAAAVALARTGHNVTVFEQATKLGEVGAGIQVPPNSARSLHRWGIAEFLQDRGVTPLSMNFRRWEDGRIIGRTRVVPEMQHNFDAPYFVVHRAHLHDALHKLLLKQGSCVELASRVVKVDTQKTSIWLSDGREFHADLIVGADGIKSILRDVVLQRERDEHKFTVPTGYAAYRASVDATDIRRDPDTAWLLKQPELNLWVGDRRHVMTYLISSESTFNMVLSHPDDTDTSTWDKSNALRDMREHFSGWDRSLTKVIAMIKTTMKWPLVTGTKLERWTHPSSNILILGDSAHAMLPYMSQGAAMAVEDGAALAEVLRQVDRLADVPQAIAVWQKVRMERSYQMQDASLINSKIWHFADGPEQQMRDKWMEPEVEGRPFVSSPNQWSDPTTQRWCYGYDAEREVRNTWLKIKETS